MSTIDTNQFIKPGHVTPGISRQQWGAFSRIVFRIFFIYFFLQVVPLDWKFYRDLFSINWLQLQYSDIFNIAHYNARFSSGPSTYADWSIIFLIALAGGFVWTYIDRNKNNDYNNLYYWLRILVRYRLAIAVIAYGFIKLFPLQAPYPSISNLNTSYGDFTRWKLFSLSLGIVPNYESFLGTVEIITGLLLLYRRTASIGAFIIIIFTGNVFMSNLAYEGGEQVYSLYLITLAIFVLAADIQRITSLLVLQKPTAPNLFKPSFDKWRATRVVVKTAFISFFVVLYAFKTGLAFYNGPYQFPAANGLAGISGIYNVSEFRLNKDTLVYAPNNAIRWQDVVFEKWNTISIRSNRSVIIDSNNVEKVGAASDNRTYELEGAAGRHYYSYQADTLHHTLTLRNKNKHYSSEILVLHYNRINDATITLAGINEHKDSVFVVLNRLNKKYLLEEVAEKGRQKPLKL